MKLHHVAFLKLHHNSIVWTKIMIGSWDSCWNRTTRGLSLTLPRLPIHD